MGFGWKDVARIGLGTGVGFLTSGGNPIGAVLGGLKAAKPDILGFIGDNAKNSYEGLLDYLDELENREELTNTERNVMAENKVRALLDESGEPYKERHVKFVMAQALMDVKGDIAEAFE